MERILLNITTLLFLFFFCFYSVLIGSCDLKQSKYLMKLVHICLHVSLPFLACFHHVSLPAVTSMMSRPKISLIWKAAQGSHSKKIEIYRRKDWKKNLCSLRAWCPSVTVTKNDKLSLNSLKLCHQWGGRRRCHFFGLPWCACCFWKRNS